MKRYFIFSIILLLFINLFSTQEKSPNFTKIEISNFDDMWDVLLQFDVDTPSGQTGLAGMEWDGTYFYASKWNGSEQLFKFDVDGNYIEPITVPLTSCRDMAYDGIYMYGSPASSEVSCWESETGTAVPGNYINVPGALVRALAYDAITDTFWSGNWGDNIVNWDRMGTILNSYPWPGSLYGLAYDNDPQSPYLYAHSQDTGCVAYQLDPNNALAQIDVMDYTAIGGTGTIAGGACAMTGWNSTYRTLGLLLQGSPDYIIVVELDFDLNPSAPGQPSDFVVTPDPAGATEAQLNWINPDTSINGEPLTELDVLRIFRNELLIYIESWPIIGEPYSYTDSSVPASGYYTYEVIFYNSFGPGIPAVETVWVGEDVPAAVEDLTLTTNPPNLVGILNWVNPTTGLHGGAFNEPILGYHIERSDGTVFELAGIATQYIDDTIPAAGYYLYSVQPYNSVGDGGIAEANLWPWPEVLINEGFYSGTFPPDGWQIEGDNWQLSNTCNAGWEIPEVDFNWVPITVGTQRLISHTIDTSGMSYLYLEFSHFINPFSEPEYELCIQTTSDGQNWHTAFEIEYIPELPIQEEIIINSIDVGSENFQIAWVFDGDSFTINDWYIDDILLTEYYLGETGSAEGYVTLIGGNGNVEDVEITVENLTIHPDETGYYFITLPIGSRDITASLYSYDPVTIEDIFIEAGITTSGIDFNLNYVELLSPENLAIDETGLFSWDAPQTEQRNSKESKKNTRDLLGYEVYLDDCMAGFTEETEWLFSGLVIGCEYEAGVTAVYEAGNSEMATIIFPPFVDSDDLLSSLETEITSIYPNPFNPSTTISFSVIQTSSFVTLEIFNIKGQKVKQLVSDQLSAGQHDVEWNGEDDDGKTVSSGIYFCRLKCGDVIQTKRMLMLK
jgi:FlgD Ig-like domain